MQQFISDAANPHIETLTSGAAISATDPWHSYYSPLIAEFIGSLSYTLFSNLIGMIGVADSASKLSIALLDGGLNFALICTFAGISGGQLNPGITFATLLTFNLRLLLGLSMIFVQFFGAFFGALLTRATLSSTVFVDSFISLGILKRSLGQNLPNFQELQKDDYEMNFASVEGNFSNRFQIYLLETLLSTLLVSTYMISSTYETVLTTASSVGACRVLTSLIGLYTLGQGSNLARQLANNVISSIFLLDDRAWRLFYISVFGAFSSSVLSAAIWWLIKGTSVDTGHQKRSRISLPSTMLNS